MKWIFKLFILFIFTSGLVLAQSHAQIDSTKKVTKKAAVKSKKVTAKKKTSKAPKVKKGAKAPKAAVQPKQSVQPTKPAAAVPPVAVPPPAVGTEMKDTLVKTEIPTPLSPKRETSGLLHRVDTLTAVRNIHSPYEKTRTIGGIGGADVTDVAIDNNGNLILAGRFQAIVNYARSWSGLPPDNKTALGYKPEQIGNPDIFITKINNDGSYGWTKRIGNAEDELFVSVAVDGDGNIYVTGSFFNTINFSEDTTTSTAFQCKSAGREDIFLLKMDPQGNLLWAKRMGGNGSDVPYDICIDHNNNVYVTGRCQPDVDFSTDWHPSSEPMVGGTRAFIVRINNDGSFGWQKKFGGNGSTSGAALSINSDNEIYVAGNFTDNIDLKTTWPQMASSEILSMGNADIFVMKLQNNGNCLWAKSIGGKYLDCATALAVNNENQVYLTGIFTDSVNFSRDFSTTTMDLKVSNGGTDIFITKLDGSGWYLWTKCLGGNSDDWSNALSVNGNEDVLLAGDFQGIVRFQADWGDQTTTTAHGGSDAIFIKINKDGGFGSAWQLGGIHADRGMAFLSYSSERYCLIGNFQGEVNFSEPFGSSPQDNINNVGDSGDIFITEVSY